MFTGKEAQRGQGHAARISVAGPKQALRLRVWEGRDSARLVPGHFCQGSLHSCIKVQVPEAYGDRLMGGALSVLSDLSLCCRG